MRQVKASPVVLAALAGLLAPGLVRCSAHVSAGADAGFPDPDQPDAGVVTEVDAGIPRELSGYLGPCETNTDCLSGFCLPSKKCSKACVKAEECPAAPGWSCGAWSGDDAMCVCVPTSATEACDGFDNNCDGTADEHALCEGANVCEHGQCTCAPENLCGPDCIDKTSDAHHCGTCERSCGTNEVCTKSNCECPGRVCDGRCLDTQYDNANCGDCGKACLANRECVDSSCVAADHEWASWTVRGVSLFSSEHASMRDRVTNFLWTQETSPEALDEPAAAAACVALRLDGYEDWRLPTRIELLSLVDYTRSEPAVDPAGFPHAPSGAMWTSTPSASKADDFWAVNFQDGTVSTFSKAVPFYVWCVR